MNATPFIDILEGRRAWALVEGDCRELLAELPESSIDAVITDPPYGLEFMGQEWDRLARPLSGDLGGFAYRRQAVLRARQAAPPRDAALARTVGAPGAPSAQARCPPPRVRRHPDLPPLGLRT